VQDLETYRKKLSNNDLAISAHDAEHIIQRWNRRIRFMKEGCLTQGLFIASKGAPEL
jgi:hypothetical protein